MGYDYGRNFFYGLSGGGEALMFLGGFLFIGLIVLVVVLLTNRSGDNQSNYNVGNNYSAHNVDEALNILNMRFARGEISDEEYRRIKSTILNK